LTTLEIAANNNMSFPGRLPVRAFFVYVGLLVPAFAAAQAPDFASDRQFAEHYGWIYNDLSAGLQQAQRKGQPVMVVIRCPP
jgi:hypothetical protein